MDWKCLCVWVDMCFTGTFFLFCFNSVLFPEELAFFCEATGSCPTPLLLPLPPPFKTYSINQLSSLVISYTQMVFYLKWTLRRQRWRCLNSIAELWVDFQNCLWACGLICVTSVLHVCICVCVCVFSALRSKESQSPWAAEIVCSPCLWLCNNSKYVVEKQICFLPLWREQPGDSPSLPLQHDHWDSTEPSISNWPFCLCPLIF